MTYSSDWIKNTPIAHRGIFDNKEIAENSASSIKKAMETNHAIELDVSVTNDNKAIIFHDDTFSRLTNIDGYVTSTNYDDLKNATLLGGTDKILSLAEALEIVGGKVPLLLDIMPSSKSNFEWAIFEALKDYKGEFAICSTNPYILEWFKLNAPTFKRGQRVSAFKKEKPAYAKKSALIKMKLNHLSEPNFLLIKLDDAKKLKCKKLIKKGSSVVLWTVKDKKGLRKANDLKTNYIYEAKDLEI